ncbi:MAG: DegV family EDD domain-containing protein [Candidatus Gastranaerophilales bacterium]|nr:DegV family EDD domain-containing protein [Candidatus Gastranaerophilales bacterium]
MWEKISLHLFGRNLDLRERIFRMIIAVGAMVALAGILECIILMDIGIILVPLSILLLVMFVALIFTFKYNKVNVAAVVVGLLIIMVVFPEMFFLSGGLDGGGTVWFVLGLFYVFLMFTGWKMKFFLGLAILVDVSVYAVGYFYPEYITPMADRTASYLDSLFAVIAVGIAGGAIMKFQMRFYEVEREIAEQQQEELKKASKSQSNFFASMSHEIRTPINTIIGLNEMILRESREKNTREYAEDIQVASKMLLSLVNDILDMSRMEMQRMEIIPVEYRLADMCQELVDIIQVRAREKSLEFRLDVDPNLPSGLMGDERRIKQVVLNLLTNAVKYTKEGSVALSFYGEMTAQDKVRMSITVRDTGIGIRKEDLQYLYQAFQRIEERENRKIEGSGLGLSISKQLVDLMGGEITVDSIYTKGSVFTVTLEQEVIDPQPVGALKILDRNDRGAETFYRQSFEAPEARILIVDDNEMNSLVVKKLLEATKVQIDVANSGEECLEKTGKKYYHVILMDYMMPQMNGVETLERLRRQENGLCRESAVIVLTANTMADARKLCEDHDFDGHLEKPIQGSRMEAAILRFLPTEILEYQERDDVSAGAESDMQGSSHRKRKRVCVTTDCTSDIPDEFLEKYGIQVMYLYIETGKGRFADTREIDSDSLSQYLLQDEHVTSSAVSVNEYEQFFADMLIQADNVVHISMAANVGNSYQTAMKAAKGFDHVHVIDSGQISGGAGLVTLYAARMAQRGQKVEEICEEVEHMKKNVATKFFLPKSDIFCQNGYMGRVAGGVCGLFGLRPILGMKQSRFDIVGFDFGGLENGWKRYIKWHLFPKRSVNTDVVLITHVGCTVRQLEFIKAELAKRITFDRVIVQKASFSNACNVGMGTIGISYYKKI